MAEDYLTTQELAEKLEVTPRTVLRMIERGELKEGVDFYRIGRSTRFFRLAMVEKYRFSEK
jgi:excisionase family DNA binding protein